MDPFGLRGEVLEMKSLGLPLVALGLALMCVVGCGGGSTTELAPVSGKVYLDGELVTGGYVQFYPADNPDLPGASGIISSDGTYSVNSGEAGSGAAVGTHKISIQPPEEQSFGEAVQTDIEIPVKYQEADSSGLTVEVPAEGVDHDIELSSE